MQMARTVCKVLRLHARVVKSSKRLEDGVDCGGFFVHFAVGGGGCAT